MAQFSVTVTNSKGFHLRPASKLLELVTGFDSSTRITLHHPQSGRSADCRNMMALMMMSSPQGTEFTFDISAENEPEIIHAIYELFASGFYDDT